MPGNVKRIMDASVADPGCLSRIPDPDFFKSQIPDLGSRISYPGSRIPSWIPDLGSRIQKQQQKRGMKKNCCLTFFVATKIKKSKIVLILNWCRKYLGQFTKK
jgi:hypothetical protein